MPFGRLWLYSLAVGVGVLFGSSARAVDFEHDVVPILLRHCSGCHNEDDHAGGLNLLTHDGAFGAGDSGSEAIKPGSVAESYLIERVESGEMPPEGKGHPVSADELASLKTWIAAGAPWPQDRVLSPFEFTTDVRGGRDWWSLQAPVRPEVPQVESGKSEVRNPIDAFVFAKLQASGLEPSAETDRATLIRRAKLDLLGLPPSPEEVQQFVADPAHDAYEQLIDRLLASPHYGERWARHWLDVVRFAESYGFEKNSARSNAWPFRDYVINAFNEDKPYPQFITEQIAGDQTGDDVGTCFLVAGAKDEVTSPDVELTAMQRLAELDDMVSTTSTAFLGLTVGCAKCHDHKFDAISQRDYYALQGIFAGVTHGERVLKPQAAEFRVAATKIRDEIATLEAAKLELLSRDEPLFNSGTKRPAVHTTGNTDRFAPALAKFVRFTIRETNIYAPCIDELEVFSSGSVPRNMALASLGAKATASGVYENGKYAIHQLAHINDGLYGNDHSWISTELGRGWVQIELSEPTLIDRIAWARDRSGAFSDRLSTRYLLEFSLDGKNWSTVATSDDRLPYDPNAAPKKLPPDSVSGETAQRHQVLQAKIDALNARLAQIKPATVYAGTFVRLPDKTHRLYRGEPLQKREEVQPGGIASVGSKLALTLETLEHERRAALARWIADERNPLTARVMVNRIWHYHFGQGLMRNPSDFGFNGGHPSHPELLDWLATEFMTNGWRPKHIHRLIMLSSAYRQSSQSNPHAAAIDGGNLLLWRFNPRRLEAEPIRDTMLSVAGNLDLRRGGPGFDLFESNGNYVKVYVSKQSFGPDEWRRMIYMTKPRMQLEATFGVFDCPDSAQPLAKRNCSTTPLQALNLLNGPFVVQQADIFARRLEQEATNDVPAQIQRAFWLAYGRAPEADEQNAATVLVAGEGLASFCRAILNSNELIFLR